MTIHAQIRRARAAIGIVAHDHRVTAGGTAYDTVSHQGLLAVVDPALDAEGLWHSSSLSVVPGEAVLLCTTTIYADDGASITSGYVVAQPATSLDNKGNPRVSMQAWGALQSYARRMGLMAALGLRDGSADQAERYGSTTAPGPAEPDRPATPADVLRPRGAALSALAARITGDELTQRLQAIADATPDAPDMDAGAPERERLGALLAGDRFGWRRLGDADFAALMVALDGNWWAK